MSSCSEIVVSSNNSTRPKFALSSLAEAIQEHRFKGKFDATASSKIAVPLMAKPISTASLGQNSCGSSSFWSQYSQQTGHIHVAHRFETFSLKKNL